MVSGQAARKQQPPGYLMSWLVLVFLGLGTGTWRRVDTQFMLAGLTQSIRTSIFLSINCVPGCELGVEPLCSRALRVSMGEPTDALRYVSCPL